MSIHSSLVHTFQKFEKPFVTYNEITLSRSSLLHNFDFFQSLQTNTHIIPVLKSNAYGHGLQEIATILKDRDFPYIAVDGMHEALAIQEVSGQRVLVMGAINPCNFINMDFSNIALVVHDHATVRALGELGKPIVVHVEIDTGMRRHGVAVDELPSFLTLLSRYPSLHVEGLMTHLADADNSEDESYNMFQTEAFDDAVSVVQDAGFSPVFIHIAQSAGSVKIASRYANTSRIGIALYGVNPLSKSDPHVSQLSSLKPVFEFTSTITKILTIKAGDSVGYGRTFVAEKDMKIGVLPVGYYEGIPRVFSNVGLVQRETQYLPVTGRVCMNHTMVRIDDDAVKVGDRVTIISNDTNSDCSVAAVCAAHALFNYEFLTGINQTIRRVIST